MIFFLRYWFPVVLLCAVIFIQSAFPSPDILPTFEWSDKMVHVLVYTVLGALLCRALNSHPCWTDRRAIVLLTGAVAAALYGLSDEWHQSFVAERTADWADVTADFAGSAIGSGLYCMGVRQRKREPNN